MTDLSPAQGADNELILEPRPSLLGQSEFVLRYGQIYENSAWVAQGVWDSAAESSRLGAQYDTVASMHRAMNHVMNGADKMRQLELLNAHPDLAGKAAVRGELTVASTDEQASAGLDQCSTDEFERFVCLNAKYRAQFPFPFIMAVRGANRFLILEAFELRLNNSVEKEYATALEQVGRIALLRLRVMAS